MFASINRFLRYKIVAVILATTLAALLVSTVALLSYEARNFRQFLISDATTQADIVARTSVPALEFNDPEAAAANLSLLDNRASVIAAAIYESDGTLFAMYVRAGRQVEFPPTVSGAGTQLEGDRLRLFHPIIHNDQLLGTVYLLATNDLPGRLKGYLLILAGVMLVSLLVAAVLSLRLQRSVSAPILAVTEVARQVIDNRDFTLRAKKTTNDEIGVLVDSFNTMLSEVGETTEALRASNRRLQRETEERRAAEAALRLADRKKDEFLATLAHELRNPLAPMVNALSMLDRDDASGTTRRRAEQILGRQLAHLVRLVDDLLDVSRITRGKLALNLESVELHAIVASAVDTVQPLMETRQHRLDIELPRELVHMQADPVRLSQVLSNLLNNAAKYTEPGGHIRLAAKAQDGSVEITVTDDGMGIPAETLPKIFQMFTQGDGSIERAQGGLGVGLALTKRLIELHGGRITARSEGPGRGATFIVQLPTIEGQAAGPAPQDLAPAAGKSAQALRILLVDDNVDFVTSLALLLEESGHEVRIAHDAGAALEAAAALRPEIAFLDLGLPGISGYELARRLRDSSAGAETVLVALSGWGQPQDRARSKSAGFSRHLVKPVEFEQILSVLDALETET